MNRRQLLKALALGAISVASSTVDMERLLWVPGAKTIFLPQAGRDFADDGRGGISIRFIRQYDMQVDRALSRLDCVYGYGLMQYDFAVRVSEGANEPLSVEGWVD